MPNEIQVINRGLVRLGVPPLASLSSADAQALVAGTVYKEVKEAALAEFPWSFALREAVLPKISVPVADERWSQYAYTYQLPPGTIRVLGLRSYDSFRLTGDQLHTDDGEARLVYINNVNESTWPEFFAKVVSYDFAASVAISLTDDARRAALMYEQAMIARRTARSIDSQQTPDSVLHLMRIYQQMSYNPLAGG